MLETIFKIIAKQVLIIKKRKPLNIYKCNQRARVIVKLV